MSKSLITVGHRGAMAYVLENTLLSFQKAIEMGIDMVELDVHKTKDNRLIVMHDDTLDRTTNGQGRIKDLTLKEIKSFSTKNNEKILTLEEVIHFLKGKCWINIEIKGEELEKELVGIIKKKKMEKEVIVSSSIYPTLIKIKKLYPRLKVAPIFEEGNLKRIEDLPVKENNSLIKLYSAHLEKKYINKKLVAEAHKKNIKIFACTLNEKQEILDVMKEGVDGIFTNKPDLLVSLKKNS